MFYLFLPVITIEDRGNNQGPREQWRESDLPHPYPPGLDLGGIRYLLRQDDVTTLNVSERHIQYIQRVRATPGLADAILRGPPASEPRDPSDEEFGYYVRGLEQPEYAFVPFTYTDGGDEFHRRCSARLMRQLEQDRIAVLESQVRVQEEDLRVREQRVAERRTTLRIQTEALRQAQETHDFERVHQAFGLEPLAPPPPPTYTSAYRRRLEEAAEREPVRGDRYFQQPSGKRQRTAEAAPLIGVSVLDPAHPSTSGTQPSTSGGGPVRQVRLIPVAEQLGESHLAPYRRASSRQRIALSSYATLAQLVIQAELNTAATRVSSATRFSAGPTERQNRRQLEDLEVASLRELLQRHSAERHARGDVLLSQVEVNLQEQLDWYITKQASRDLSQRREAEARQRKEDEEARALRAARFEDLDRRERSDSYSSRGGRSYSSDRHQSSRGANYDPSHGDNRDRSRRESRDSAGSSHSSGRPGSTQQPNRGRGRGGNVPPAPKKSEQPGSKTQGGPPAGIEDEPEYEAERRGAGAWSAKGKALRGYRTTETPDNRWYMGGTHYLGANRPRTPPGTPPGATDPTSTELRRIRTQQERREQVDLALRQRDGAVALPSAVPPARRTPVSQQLGDPVYEQQVQEARDRIVAYKAGRIVLADSEVRNLLCFIQKYDAKKKDRERELARPQKLRELEEQRRLELEQILRSNEEARQTLQAALTPTTEQAQPITGPTSTAPSAATAPGLQIPAATASTPADTAEGMQVDSAEVVITPGAAALIVANWADEPIEVDPLDPVITIRDGEDESDRGDVDYQNFPHLRTGYRDPKDTESHSDSASVLQDHSSQSGSAFNPGFYTETLRGVGQSTGASNIEHNIGGGEQGPASGLFSPRRSNRLANIASPSSSNAPTELLVGSPGGSSTTSASTSRAGRGASTGARTRDAGGQNNGQSILHAHQQQADGSGQRPDGQLRHPVEATGQDGGGIPARGRTEQRILRGSPRSTNRGRGGGMDKESHRRKK